MTRLLPAFLAAFLAAAPAWGAISFVASAKQENTTSSATCDVTMPAHSVDDLLVVWGAVDGARTLTVAGGGETWNNLTNEKCASNQCTGRMFWAIATGTSSFTVTVTSDTADFQACIASAFDGTHLTAPNGNQGTTSTGTSNAPTADGPSSLSANSWVVCGVAFDGAGLNTAPTNATEIQIANSGGGGGATSGGLAYDSAPSASETYTWASGGSNQWASYCMEYLEDAGGGPPPRHAIVVH